MIQHKSSRHRNTLIEGDSLSSNYLHSCMLTGAVYLFSGLIAVKISDKTERTQPIINHKIIVAGLGNLCNIILQILGNKS